MNNLAIYEITENDIQRAAEQHMHRRLTNQEMMQAEVHIAKGMRVNEETVFACAFDELSK